MVEAASTSQAVKLLREKELFVIDIHEAKPTLSLASTVSRYKRIGFGDIVNFTRQLATMVVAGLNLPEALTILRTQTTNPTFEQMLSDIEHHIVGGGNLADALSRYPKQFSTIYIALVAAGETSGSLEQVLARLADTLEGQREFRSKITGAMIYPVIIIIGMVGVVFVLMTVVVPRLSELYRDLGISLPVSTQILLKVSDFFVHFWWLMIALIIGFTALFERWRKTPIGELMVDTFVLRLPVFGDLQKKVILVEFTRTLGMLISSGIHILEGLRILKESLGNVLFRNAITSISTKVEKGFPLGATFGQYEVFPPIVSQMMKVGEETGKLDETLSKLSKYFEAEADHLVKGLTTAIEPIIMIFLGVGVGFIVFSVITPIYNLTSNIR